MEYEIRNEFIGIVTESAERTRQRVLERMDAGCICTKHFQLFISIYLLVYVFSLHNYLFLEKSNYLEIYC